MIAYKFLRRGAVAPFTEFAWPAPGPDRQAPWVEASGEGAAAAVHACRPADLPYWLNDELWRVELGGQVREQETHLEADRARLVERVAAWGPGNAGALARACALRARELAVEALRAEGHAAAAAALAAAPDLPALQALRDAPAVQSPPRAEELAGYAIDAAFCAASGNGTGAAFVAAVTAAAANGDPKGYAEERAWQARWLEKTLGL